MSSLAASGRLRGGALCGAVLLVAFVARLPSLGEGFWIDEVMSAAIIEDPWSLMFARIGFTDVHPPGYYAALKLWSALFGDGDLALRASSLVAGLGTVAVVFYWAQRHSGATCAVVAGLLLACSPFHAHYSVEVRSYALFGLVALALAWGVERWLRAPSSRGLVGVVFLEIVALSLHYYALLWVALLNLVVFLHPSCGGRARRLAWLRGQSWALAALALWLPLLLVQLFELPEVMKAHLSDELPLSRVVASLGPLPSASPGLFAIVVGGAIALAAVVGSWTLWRRPPLEPAEAPSSSSALWSVVLLCIALIAAPLVLFATLPMSDAMIEAYLRQLPWAYLVILGALTVGGALALTRRPRLALPILVVLALGGPLLVLCLHQVQPMLFLRNLLVFVPPLTVLAALALSRAPVVAQGVVALVVVSLFGSHASEGSASFMPRQDFQGAVTALDGALGVPVIVAPGWDAMGASRYGSERSVMGAMSVQEISQSLGVAPSVVVLLSRPQRLDLTEEQLSLALAPSWRLDERRELRGHRGAMQWLRYQRVGDD